MKVLFIGGNGNISWWCVQKALELGFDVWELNRGVTLKTRRAIQPEIHKLTCDIRDPQGMASLLKGLEFDVVADFICFNPEQARADIELFRNITRQFIYVSTEAVYQRRGKLPLTETTPKYSREVKCDYIKGKIGAEEEFLSAYAQSAFPVTIVRPGYTYDTIVPYSIGHNCFTASQRYLEGKPVLIAGDGNNLWTFTHSSDFASAFVGLFGHQSALGEDFHIMSDENITWNDALKIMLDMLAIKLPKYIHIPYEDVLSNERIGESELMLQKMSDFVFDSSKIKKLVPGWHAKVNFQDGIRQTYDWLFEDEQRRRINPQVDAMMESLTLKYNAEKTNA